MINQKQFNITDSKRIIRKTSFFGLCFLLILAVLLCCSTTSTYIITVGDTQICVENKKVAQDVMSEVIKLNIPEGAEMQDCIKAENIKISDGYNSNILDKKEAVQAVQNALSDKATLTILCTKEETAKIKPKTEYIKDDTMFAGESEIVQEGKSGQKILHNLYTVTNGQIVDTNTLEEEIIKEAVPEKVKKGTIGLPEDADWKTYDGEPVFKDGNDLVKTSLKYLGAPYKYGGHSLKTGIDCVQFIRQMYAKFGINLPNGKYGLQRVGKAVSYKNAQPGDIICYSGHHYAIYMGDGKIVHASSRGGVSTKDNAKYRKIVTIRRVVN